LQWEDNAFTIIVFIHTNKKTDSYSWSEEYWFFTRKELNVVGTERLSQLAQANDSALKVMSDFITRNDSISTFR